MELRKLQRLVVDALEDIKAQDIVIFDTTLLTSLFDRVVIASATSNRQSRSLANNVRDKVKAAGGHVISVEGEETGEWVLVDLGEIVVHIMQPAIRQYYHLEEIWGGKKVRVRLGAPDLPAVPADLAVAARVAPATTPKPRTRPKAPVTARPPGASAQPKAPTRSAAQSATGRRGPARATKPAADASET
jgi:ribosome-associated protein